MAFWHNLENFSVSLDHRSHYTLLAAAGISLSVAGGLFLRTLYPDEHRESKVLHSPLVATRSSVIDNNSHPLPLDVLPGARDVQTPYGSIRVYEWGPEDGPKVLLVHGITTPCVSLGGLAHALVDRGCRVIVFDLFGRGYSDCPADLPQDERLFTTQIFLALTSSPISWTGAGSGRFCLVGYSLGGGIAASFASYFPQLLTSLVLLAPAGLIRDSHITFRTRLLYSGGLPERLLKYLSGKRLRAGPLSGPSPQQKKSIRPSDALTQELPSESGAEKQILSRSYPNVTVPAAVFWQVNNHAGFVHAFVSSMRNGPILGQRQRQTWERLGGYLAKQNALSAEEQKSNGLPSDKVVIITGENDSIIIQNEVLEDARATLGGDVTCKHFSAGHEFPSTKYSEVAQIVFDTLV
ncbi:Alpha/Beta hydrolase protein [Aspergillus unguis]